MDDDHYESNGLSPAGLPLTSISPRVVRDSEKSLLKARATWRKMWERAPHCVGGLIVVS